MSSAVFPSPTSFRDRRHQALQHEQQRERRLWGTALTAVVTFVAVSVALSTLIPRSPPAVSLPPPAAIAIDLAPLPTAIPTPPQDVPKGPKQTQAQPDPTPEEPPKIAAPPSPAPHPPAPVPKTETRKIVKKTVVKPVSHKEKPLPLKEAPAERTTAPPSTEAPPAVTQASPSPGASSSHASRAPASWQSDLVARLERFKRYPTEAQRHREEGTPLLTFTMNRKGRVLSARLTKPSGYTLLDQETLALVRRAEPLPEPPDSVSGDTITLTVPIEFYVE
ncbi:TonB periplasmic protein [Acetobacter estunensis NRIC 0472]|uniref:TonB family protein n=1 Tax=Acetobacter estunensis TaxID=104097 RepID=A0A967B674_9PROT|nr:energy transducer TonB [Acetobacter estunensis]NHO54560.1 TonB family protein [Acetobacter estunensis]GBQ26765.1 TonB periplasmic protein [Acetobacter estunensis NRIC 0472]